MTRTTIPVGLPYPKPTQAYWQTPPLPISDHRSTPGLPEIAKYAIVGSGISGAIIAHKLLQADLSSQGSIVMLEARQTCSGATGRNGGHCRAGRYLEFKNYLETFGKDEALRMEKLEEENVKNVAEFIKTHSIECDLRAVDTVDIFTDQKEWQKALHALEARYTALREDVGPNVQTTHVIWNAQATKEKFLIPEGVGAVSFPAYKLSPYKFICGLLDICIGLGLNLQTNTAVLEVSPVSMRNGKHLWTVHTERGTMLTENVILATNAYTSALYPPLSDFIIPTRAQIAAIRPGSNIAGNPALQRTCSLNSAAAGDYFQSRSEGTSGAGDLLVGGGRRYGTNGEQPVLDDTTIHPRVSEHLLHTCARFFGRENWGENGKTLQEWTGIMGYTRDGQPVVGKAPGHEGLYISAGFNGHGMALAFQSGEALVQIILGKEKEVDEWLPKCYNLSRIPGRRGKCP